MSGILALAPSSTWPLWGGDREVTVSTTAYAGAVLYFGADASYGDIRGFDGTLLGKIGTWNAGISVPTMSCSIESSSQTGVGSSGDSGGFPGSLYTPGSFRGSWIFANAGTLMTRTYVLIISSGLGAITRLIVNLISDRR